MSLVKQLLLAICLFLLVAFSGSFLVSLESSRDQLQTQLRSHAQDAATALGLSLTPHVDDPAMLELMVSSIFDSGYFASIRIVAVNDGSILVERTRSLEETRAPAWFVRLVNLQAQGGEALLMQGWQQFARVEVISHPQFALDKLWSSALGTLGWLLLCGLVSALLGALLLKRQLQPLLSMADQAEAITRREYRMLTRVPRTPELKHVVTAMNQMVGKLKTLFEQEAAQTEHYRRQAYHDALTDLPNRLALEHALAAALTSGESADGHLLAIRLINLNLINQQLGAERTDSILQALAEPLKAAQKAHPDWLCCRSRGGEFLVLAPGSDHQELLTLSEQLGTLAYSLDDLTETIGSEPIAFGLAGYQQGEKPATVLGRVDQALALCALQGNRIQPGYLPCGENQSLADSHSWQQLLERALLEQRFVLHFQPVMGGPQQTDLMHYKLLVRLPDQAGNLMNAGHFLPWIERLGLSSQFDQCMLSMAVKHLDSHPHSLALSITADTLNSNEQRQSLRQILEQHKPQARLLILEADARYIQDCHNLGSFAEELRPLGTHLALQHFGRQLSMIGELALIGLDYLKVDSSFIRDLDCETEKHLYLEALVRTAQRIDLPLIAEQVQTEGEIKALKNLGIECMQGHALAKPDAWPL